MHLTITDFIKYLNLKLGFEGIERCYTKEMKAGGLPEGTDVGVDMHQSS